MGPSSPGGVQVDPATRWLPMGRPSYE